MQSSNEDKRNEYERVKGQLTPEAEEVLRRSGPSNSRHGVHMMLLIENLFEFYKEYGSDEVKERIQKYIAYPKREDKFIAKLQIAITFFASDRKGEAVSEAEFKKYVSTKESLFTPDEIALYYKECLGILKNDLNPSTPIEASASDADVVELPEIKKPEKEASSKPIAGISGEQTLLKVLLDAAHVVNTYVEGLIKLEQKRKETEKSVRQDKKEGNPRFKDKDETKETLSQEKQEDTILNKLMDNGKVPDKSSAWSMGREVLEKQVKLVKSMTHMPSDTDVDNYIEHVNNFVLKESLLTKLKSLEEFSNTEQDGDFAISENFAKSLKTLCSILKNTIQQSKPGEDQRANLDYVDQVIVEVKGMADEVYSSSNDSKSKLNSIKECQGTLTSNQENTLVREKTREDVRKAVVAVCISATAMVVMAAVGAVLGLMLGSFSGPGVVATSILGAVTGAAAGLAIGAAIAESVTGKPITNNYGLTLFGLRNPTPLARQLDCVFEHAKEDARKPQSPSRGAA
jgi:hypothetical protein